MLKHSLLLFILVGMVPFAGLAQPAKENGVENKITPPERAALNAPATAAESELNAASGTLPHLSAPSSVTAAAPSKVGTPAPNKAAAEEQETSSEPYAANSPSRFVEAVCLAIGHEALTNGLPADFFTRLIWQESRFNPNARSHKGAEGIAQFVPGTARWRGLSNPYEPFKALRESARWLGELRVQFGNLGLAAAAYNAGPGRVQNWLSRAGELPGETRAYVRIVTGRSAEEWAQGSARDGDDLKLPNIVPCTQVAKMFVGDGIQVAHRYGVRSTTKAGANSIAAWAPWGLQLIGNWSESRALGDYRKLQAKFSVVLGNRQPLVIKSRMAGRGSALWYRVRVAETTRERASELCAKLESAGGKCLVFRN